MNTTAESSLHALRKEALQIGVKGAAVPPHDVQLGFDFHAVPSTFVSNNSRAGAACVAQTSFCSS